MAFLEASDRERFHFAAACPLPSALGDALGKLRVERFDVRFGRPRRRLGLELLSEGTQVLRAAGRLQKVMREFRPDLVDANTTLGGLHAVLAMRGCSLPLVWHVRDLKPTGLAGRIIARRAGAVLPVSQAVASRLARDGMDASKVHVIHNGIDPERFRPLLDSRQVRQKFNLPSDAPLVAVVGQLTPWKGHDVLLRAWGELRRRSSRAVLLIVGSALWHDDAKWEDRLKSLADNLRLEGSVRFLWRQSDVASIVGAASILVVPSLAEPFGRVALEAMALSKPVVGTNAGGLPEVVADGVTGVLVPPGDAQALADAMERVLTDAQLAERLGRAGAARVRESFHIDRTAALSQDIYGRLLQSWGGQ